MQSLDNIITSQWSNIPGCVVQSINILVELSRIQHTQLDSLKTQLVDLSLKYSVKSGRSDIMIEELTNSFKLFNSATFKDIKDFKESNTELKTYVDSKFKIFNDNLNELKSRFTVLNTDFRKENREFTNKIEKIKNDASQIYVENVQKSQRMIEESLEVTNERFKGLIFDINKSISESQDKYRIVESKVEAISNHLDNQILMIKSSSNPDDKLKNIKLLFALQ